MQMVASGRKASRSSVANLAPLMIRMAPVWEVFKKGRARKTPFICAFYQALMTKLFNGLSTFWFNTFIRDELDTMSCGKPITQKHKCDVPNRIDMLDDEAAAQTICSIIGRSILCIRYLLRSKLYALIMDMEVGILGKKQRIILFGSPAMALGPELTSKLQLFHQRIMDGGYDTLLAEHFPHQAYHKRGSGKKFYEEIANGLGLLKENIADCNELYRSKFYQRVFLAEAASFLDLPKMASDCTLASMDQSLHAHGNRRMPAADSMQALDNAAEPEEEDADDPEHHDDNENAHEDADTGPHSGSKKQGNKRSKSMPSLPVALVGDGIKVGTQ